MNINDKIKKLLPKGLEQETINELAKLFSEDLQEAVKEVRAEASAKMLAFIRANMDTIKESAIAELELENETYRKAQLFEGVSNIMATELTDESYEDSMNVAYSKAQELEEQREFLTGELDKALRENSKLVNSVKALNESNNKLKTQVKAGASKLEESVGNLKEFKAKREQKLSDKAHIHSQEKIELTESRGNNGNEFLSESVLNLFPKSK